MTRSRDTADIVEDVSVELASKVDYATTTNAQTGTTYTFVLADAEKLTTASNAAAVTLTIPPQSSATWLANTVLRIVNYGAGDVTVNGGSGVTVTNTATTIGQYESAAAIRTAEDAWTLVPFGSKAATFAPPSVEYLVVAGGGGGGAGGSNYYGGGGGAGGYRTNLGGTPKAVTTATSYTVTVGGGGAYTNTEDVSGTSGSNSVFDTITSTGGGGGAGSTAALSGGSGGGGSYLATSGGAGTSGQGFRGANYNTGGQGAPGGSSSAAGSDSSTVASAGTSNSITGTAVTYARGGDGSYAGTGGAGTNNGNGGKGGRPNGGQVGNSGVAGIVVIRHHRAFRTATTTGSPTVSTEGDYTVYKFTASGTIEWAA